MNTLSAVAWRQEGWLKPRQGSGYPGQWAALPLTSLPTRWDGCSWHSSCGSCLCKLLQQDLQTSLLSHLMDFLSHSFPSPCPALGDAENDAALRTDLMSRTRRQSPWFCFPRLWIFNKHLLFPEFTFPREEQPQEIVSVKSPGKKTVMWYRSDPEKRWERLLLHRGLPKGNQPTVNNVWEKKANL